MSKCLHIQSYKNTKYIFNGNKFVFLPILSPISELHKPLTIDFTIVPIPMNPILIFL